MVPWCTAFTGPSVAMAASEAAAIAMASTRVAVVSIMVPWYSAFTGPSVAMAASEAAAIAMVSKVAVVSIIVPWYTASDGDRKCGVETARKRA